MSHSTPRSTSSARRPRSIAVAIGVAAASTLLGACGVLAAFVPPLSVGDPMGVDGREVTAPLEDGALALQSRSHIDETGSFDVADLDENLRGFSLAGFHIDAGLDSAVTLSGPAGATAADFPGTFTVTRAVVAGTLEDDANGAVSFSRDVELALPFARTDCDEEGCAYAYAGTDALDEVLSVELTDRDELARLVSILMLRGDETPNRGTFRVAIEIEADTPLAGYTVGFQLTSEGSTIRLGG